MLGDASMVLSLERIRQYEDKNLLAAHIMILLDRDHTQAQVKTSWTCYFRTYIGCSPVGQRRHPGTGDSEAGRTLTSRPCPLTNIEVSVSVTQASPGISSLNLHGSMLGII
jgi:hypothetical protein